MQRAKNAQNQNGAPIWVVFSAQVLRTGPQRGVISSAPTAFQGPRSEKSDTAKSVTKTIWGFPGERSAALRWDFCIRNDGSAQAASQVWGPLLQTWGKGWNCCSWNLLREVRAPSVLTHTVIVDLYEKTWTRFLSNLLNWSWKRNRFDQEKKRMLKFVTSPEGPKGQTSTSVPAVAILMRFDPHSPGKLRAAIFSQATSNRSLRNLTDSLGSVTQSSQPGRKCSEMAKRDLLLSQIRGEKIYAEIKWKILTELQLYYETWPGGDAQEASDAGRRLCIRQAAISQHLVDTSPHTNVFSPALL